MRKNARRESSTPAPTGAGCGRGELMVSERRDSTRGKEGETQMGKFGGKKHGFDWKAKGPGFYGCTREDLLKAWEWYQRGLGARRIIEHLRLRSFRHPISFRKLVVEWGAMGLPVWEFGRRSKIREGTTQALKRLQEKFDMPTTATMWAALKFVEVQEVDLKAIVAAEFGQAPARPKRWYQRPEVQRVLARAENMDRPDNAQGG